MLAKSNNSRLEKFGKTITFCCMSLIVFVVALILIFVAQRDYRPSLSTRSMSLVSFSDPHGIHQEKEFGALPMILGSFIVTLFSALVATPCHRCSSLMTEVSPKGARLYNQLLNCW